LCDPWHWLLPITDERNVNVEVQFIARPSRVSASARDTCLRSARSSQVRMGKASAKAGSSPSTGHRGNG
jgi:hypothetical protein